jgi:hypothetical protein
MLRHQVAAAEHGTKGRTILSFWQCVCGCIRLQLYLFALNDCVLADESMNPSNAATRCFSTREVDDTRDGQHVNVHVPSPLPAAACIDSRALKLLLQHTFAPSRQLLHNDSQA